MNERIAAYSAPSGPATHAAPDGQGQAAPQAALTAILGVLGDTGRFVASLTDAQYVDATVNGPRGTIGAHVRHSLDHVEALLDGVRTGLIDYDARHRGTPVERDRPSATERIDVLNARLSRFTYSMDLPIRVQACIKVDSPPVEVASTVGRELLFVLSHTIHHQAMIAYTAARLNVPLRAEFGVAPATLRHLAAVRSAASGS